MNTNDKYRKAAEAVNKAGGTPLPVTDTLLDILKLIIAEDELDFIIAFTEQRSQTMDQLKQSTGLPEQEILKKTSGLARRGVIFDQPNRKGVIVYRLLPLINVGTFEYTFMKKLERSDRDKQLASLFAKLFEEADSLVQANYDGIVASLEQWPPVDRTVPALENTASGESVVIEINETIEAPADRILPVQKVEEIIAKFDQIAVGHCFCRHHKDMMDKPCKQTKVRENCFTFGKSARYTSSQGFSRFVSKEEALKILRRAEDDGLVHKAYHPNFDVSKDETSICNCCSCCCAQARKNLIAPTINVTNYLAQVNAELCAGCGICIEHCHTDAIFINDDGIAEKIERYCIGCGLCATHCPQNAVYLVEGERIVRIPPDRKDAAS